MAQSVAERAKAFGELANPKHRRKEDAVRLPTNTNNLQSDKATTRNAGSSSAKESGARYNLTAALSNSARNFETPRRQGYAASTKVKLESPKGVHELNEDGQEENSGDQTNWKTEIEQEVEDALIGIQVLRFQVEQMKLELEEVRKKKKDYMAKSKEEYKALVDSLKKVELLREENCRMVDEINRMESASYNY